MISSFLVCFVRTKSLLRPLRRPLRRDREALVMVVAEDLAARVNLRRIKFSPVEG